MNENGPLHAQTHVQNIVRDACVRPEFPVTYRTTPLVEAKNEKRTRVFRKKMISECRRQNLI
jgi:hypothetical protein